MVQWFGKRPTRLPEGLNIVFSPVERPLYRKYKWWLNKIDDLVDPLNVVVNGSQRLHGRLIRLLGLRVCLFGLILYVPIISWDESSWVEPVISSGKSVLLKDTTQ